jgi:tetratricopeptide (TPR) repeat protein
MLTPNFQQRLENDLRDQLQLALGKLAEVKVVRSHPLLSEIRTRGLQAVLGGWDEISGVRTQFVLVEFSGSQYRIQTGQHDGLTGLSSPVVREEALSDARRVADTAVRMVLDDFGVVGTFQNLDGTSVELAIHGGGLVDSLASWVKVGDVFAVVRLSREGSKLRGTPIEAAVLEVIEAPQAGRVRCRYFSRYEGDRALTDDPRADAGGDSPALGYRCLKLHTIQGPLKLRLVNDKTQEFLSTFRVVISSDPSFKPNAVKAATFQGQGLFEDKGPFTNVVYVRIQSGDTPLVEMPVPLVDDGIIVCRMSPDPTAIKHGEVLLRFNRWVRWCHEAFGTNEERLKEFNVALARPPLDAAAKLGQQTLDALKAETDRLSAERSQLTALAATHKLTLDYSEGDQLLGALNRRHEQLNAKLVKVQEALKDQSSDARKELVAMEQRAELLENQAEFDQAIKLYEKILEERPDSKNVKAHLDQLKAAWAIKSKDHAQARQFIYDTWPGLDLPGLKANIAKARDMLARCKQAEDKKTPLKLVLVNFTHASALTKRIEVLRRSPVDTDGSEMKSLVQLSADLRALQDDAVAWVTGKEKKSAK